MLKTNGTELIDESADVCLHFSGHVTSPAFGRVLNFCWNSRWAYFLVHLLWAHQPTPRSIKITPQALYTGLLNTIPQHSSSHIHTHFTNLAIQKLGPNTILGTPAPEIHHSELVLSRVDRVHLSRLRCGTHTALATYRKRIDDSVDEVCTHCSSNTHSLTHIMTHCPALTHIRAQNNISSPLDLWQSPATVCVSSEELACSDRQAEAWQQQQQRRM